MKIKILVKKICFKSLKDMIDINIFENGVSFLCNVK